MDMDYLSMLIKRDGFTKGEFMDLLGYSRRTWYVWKNRGGVPTEAFVKLALLFDWIAVPNDLHLTLITNRI